MLLRNRTRIWMSSRSAQLAPDTYPNAIGIEPTNLCNLSCLMCPRPLMQRKTGLMDFSLFKKIVDESKGKTELLYMANGVGEPLIHPNIIEMIEYANKSGIHTMIGTNGTLLTKDLTTRLFNSGLDIIELSIDAATSSTYNKIRGGKNYEQLLKNLRTFSEANHSRKSAKPFTILQFIMTKFNVQEAEQFYKKFKGAGFDLLAFINCHTWAGNIENFSVNCKKPLGKFSNCRLLWSQVAILWNGDVTPCNYDFDGKSVIGNVNNNSLKEIWNSSKMLRIRNYHFSGNYAKVECCKYCCPIQPYDALTFLEGAGASELNRILNWYFSHDYPTKKIGPAVRLITEIKTVKEYLKLLCST